MRKYEGNLNDKFKSVFKAEDTVTPALMSWVGSGHIGSIGTLKKAKNKLLKNLDLCKVHVVHDVSSYVLKECVETLDKQLRMS